MLLRQSQKSIDNYTETQNQSTEIHIGGDLVLGLGGRNHGYCLGLHMYLRLILTKCFSVFEQIAMKQ